MTEARQNDVYLLRHGATEWSESGRHTGRTDLPLNERGREEATALARLLEGRTFALVLVSPLGRAQETCKLAGYGDWAEVDDDLLEWDYGDYEGRSTREIRVEHPGWSVWTDPIVGGESVDEVAARTERVIERAVAADGDVALFAHGHVLRILTARWCELDPRAGKRFPLATGTMSVLGWEHEYRAVRLWNQHV